MYISFHIQPYTICQRSNFIFKIDKIFNYIIIKVHSYTTLKMLYLSELIIVKQKTAQEIWNYDNIKKECAEYYGYDILYIWEYDYYQNREEVINKCIEFLNS